MTEKSLSEKICEACGIKPEYNYIGHYPETDEKGIILPPKLPDFENNNNNFVKLLNIIYTCGINQKYDYQLATLSFEEDWCYYSEEYPNTFQHRYLEVLLYLLSKNYDSWDNKFQKIIKQAIREAKWEV